MSKTGFRPFAYILDLDGTLALRTDRGPYEYERVQSDAPNWRVIDVLAVLAHTTEHTHHLFVVSGRPDSCRGATARWLEDNLPFSIDALFMRAEGDDRPDEIVKAEIYEEKIQPFYRTVAVWDDRDKVVKMWRERGLQVFQVADGNF